MKKLYLKTYGCQMNVYDSGKMKDIMSAHGFVDSDVVSGANLVILNTCHIREKAAEKVYSDLGRIRKEKDKMSADGKKMIIAVAGCVAQAEGEEIIKRAPYVDIVVGPQAYHRLPEMVDNIDKLNKKSAVELSFKADEKFDNVQFIENKTTANKVIANKSENVTSAFLSIQEGCDKFCTYCVVPYTRGAEFSRPVNAIEKEACLLAESGVREITLLGQNVNAFHGRDKTFENIGLGGLIRQLSAIDGLERIRYITSHPKDVEQGLIDAHRDVEKLMPYLHLPVQSGSNNILKAMNRQHEIGFYRDIIDKFSESREDMAFSSDFIVGFPNETDADFQDTLDIVEYVGYAQTYSFIYSPRPGTPAALYEDNIPLSVKKERLQILQSLINKKSREFNQNMIGKIVPVLFDRIGKREGQIVGSSPYMQAVYINAKQKDYLGKIVNVKINGAYDNSLSGDIIL